MRLMLLILFLLVGCATSDKRNADFKAYNDMINAGRSTGEIGYAQGQRLKWDYYKTLFPKDAGANEAFAYSVMLGEKVDAKQMSRGEYDYLVEKNLAELQQREEADGLRRAQRAALIMQAMPKNEPVQYQPVQTTPLKQPTRTNCYTDKFGYTNCTTY